MQERKSVLLGAITVYLRQFGFSLKFVHRMATEIGYVGKRELSRGVKKFGSVV